MVNKPDTIPFVKATNAVGNFTHTASAIKFDHLSDNNPYTTYSGADIIATISMPGGETYTMGELQTISYSIHRENTPVRFLGKAGPVAFVRGGRTIAGSMIFTVFNSYAFYKVGCLKDRVVNNQFPLADQIPPFDITITFSNEYGSFSKMRILGITIVDEGGTMSVDDLMIEQTYTFMARDIEPIIAYKPGYLSDKGNARYTDDTQTPGNTNNVRIDTLTPGGQP